VLRAPIHWGRFQDPPLLSTTPFHRFGVSIKAREEVKRDRRIHREEGQALLAACQTMASAEHKAVGPAMHDRIIGALETCCRQGEMLRIRTAMSTGRTIEDEQSARRRCARTHRYRAPRNRAQPLSPVTWIAANIGASQRKQNANRR
jgi:hypothetical protein